MVDMETLSDRFKEARRAKPATQEELGRIAGVSKQAISKIESGQTLEPATSTLEPIARHLGVSLRWLMTGRGQRAEVRDTGEPDWASIQGVRQAAALGDGAAPDEYAETHRLKFRADSLRRKKLAPDKLAVIYGKGDSMHPTIKNGDAILIDTSDKAPKDGKLFVITYDGDLIAKRLMELDGTWYAKSDNDADPKWRKPRKLDPSRGIEIAGRIRWVAGWVD